MARVAAGQAQADAVAGGGNAGPQFRRIINAAPGAVLAEDLWFDLLEIDHTTADGGNADLDYLPLLASICHF